MAKSKKPAVKSSHDYVRLRRNIVEMVRKHKKTSGIAIGAFIEKAIIEKLKSGK